MQLPVPIHSFWDFNIGNVLTLTALLAGFFGWLLSRNSDSAILRQRVALLERWQEAHEKEAGNRDRLISELEKCTTRLTTLAEVAQKRIEELDRRRVHGD